MVKYSLQETISKILREDRAGNNQIPDPLRFSYLYEERKEIEAEVENLIKNSNYVASDIYRIDVPKENFTIRPMARPTIKDWIIYQYIVDKISLYITDKVSSRSFSILNFKNPTRKVEAWTKFQDKTQDLYIKGFKYCVVTDISGYFENIKLEELRLKIFNYIPKEDKETAILVDILFHKILYKWSYGRLKNFGLPQGPQASGYLGDIYLDNIDEAMEKFQGYFRYMDDIRIYCQTLNESKIALICLIKELRKYKLNINSKKTRLLQRGEIITLFDNKRLLLNTIQEAFESGNKTRIRTVMPLLMSVFTESFTSSDRFPDRHCKFAVFRLAIAKNSGIPFNYESVIDQILKSFENKPHLSDIFCGFLVLFPTAKVKDFLLNYILSGESERIYEWQELHVLRSLLEVGISYEENVLEVFIERFNNKNTHWALRSLYGLLIGKFGTNKMREIIKDNFFDESNEELKKNILISLQELGVASRNEFYNDCKDEIWPKSFIKYLKNLKNNMYFRPYEKVKIEQFQEEGFPEDYYS